MGRLIIRRLGQAIPLLFIVSVLVYVLEALVPGNVALQLLGGLGGTDARYKQLEQYFGLNQPLYVQYWHWLDGVFHGSLGRSLLNDQSVTSILGTRLAVSLALIIGATIVLVVVGIGIGVLAAASRGVVSRTVDVLAYLGLAIPAFWLGPLLIALLAIHFRVFPPEGFVPFGQSAGAWASSLVLPVIVLAASPLAIVAKQTRDAMMDALDREFIRVMRANGLSRGSIYFKHALRSAAVPIVTILGTVFVQLINLSVVVEVIFALPGMGSELVSAVTAHDLPVVEGIIVCFTLFVVVVNLSVDLIVGWINPRARIE
jgi:peptide/nickel transport system permease protein